MNTISQLGGEDIDQHISEPELSALLKQCLTPGQAARLQQHLLRCQACVELYRDANDFGLPQRAEDPVVSEIQIQASWNQIKSLLGQPETHESVMKPIRPTALTAAARLGRSLALPLAATLFLSLSLVALMLWRNQQYSRSSTNATIPAQEVLTNPSDDQPVLSANQPKAAPTSTNQQRAALTKVTSGTADNSLPSAIHDVATLVLTSGEKGTAEKPSSQSLLIPVQATQLRFKFVRYKATEFPSYQVELLSAVGEVQQVAQGSLEKNKKDSLIEAVFSREGITDGEYQLRVTGQGREDADQFPQTTPFIKLSFQVH